MSTYKNDNLLDDDFCQVNCRVNVIHHEQVDKATRCLPAASLLNAASELFSMLGDATRLRILHSLKITELCVCDLASILNLSPSAVSHQLRLLRAKGMVRCRKEGKIAYYSLSDEHVHVLLSTTLDHLKNC